MPLLEESIAYKKYVLGFMFAQHLTMVMLVRKAKPEWQEGMLNGVGGGILAGESAIPAMVREFKEETGIKTRRQDWNLHGFLDSHTHNSRVYLLSNQYGYMDQQITALPDEPAGWYHVSTVCLTNKVVPNLEFLISMARLTYRHPEFREVATLRYAFH